jgi:excisionase family DNA binding protein
MDKTAASWRGMFTVAQFCETHGISPTTFYELKKEGRAPSVVKIGRRTLIPREAAEDWRRELLAGAA